MYVFIFVFDWGVLLLSLLLLEGVMFLFGFKFKRYLKKGYFFGILVILIKIIRAVWWRCGYIYMCFVLGV